MQKAAAEFGGESQIAAFLLILGERYARTGYSDTRFNLRIIWLDVASFLGLSQENVSLALSRLDEAGVIRTHNKELHVFDVEKLRQIVERARRPS